MILIIGPLFLVLVIGFAAGFVRRFAKAEAGLNAFVLYFALPAFVFQSIAHSDSDASVPLSVFVAAVGVPLLVSVAVYGAVRVFGGRGRELAAVLSLASGFGNVGYLGIPVVVSLVGPGAGLAAGIVPMLHNLLFMVGYPLFCSFAEQGRRGGSRSRLRTLWAIVRKALLLNPIMLATAAGLVVWKAPLRLPGVVDATIGIFAQATIPAALFAVGLALRPALASLRSGSVPVAALLGSTAVKLLVLPAATWGAVLLFAAAGAPVGPVWAAALVLIAATPTSASAYILAHEHENRGMVAAATVLVSSAAAMVTLPVVGLLLVG